MRDMLKVIQGDTVNLKVTVDANADLVEKMYFSCSSLAVAKELLKVVENGNTYWLLQLTPEETKCFKKCCTSYDLTVDTYDGQVQTVVYNGSMQVLKKENVVNGN